VTVNIACFLGAVAALVHNNAPGDRVAVVSLCELGCELIRADLRDQEELLRREQPVEQVVRDQAPQDDHCDIQCRHIDDCRNRRNIKRCSRDDHRDIGHDIRDQGRDAQTEDDVERPVISQLQPAVDMIEQHAEKDIKEGNKIISAQYIRRPEIRIVQLQPYGDEDKSFQADQDRPANQAVKMPPAL